MRLFLLNEEEGAQKITSRVLKNLNLNTVYTVYTVRSICLLLL